MKLMVILLTGFLLQASAKSFSQQITFSGKDVPLEKIFNVIEQQTGYVVFYNYNLIRESKKISVHANAIPLEEFLRDCFSNLPLKYVIEAKTILVTKKDPTPPVTLSIAEGASLVNIHGKVLNEKGEPAASVTVTVKGTRNVTATDDNGEFGLSGVDAGATLVFTGTNVETFEMSVNGKTEVAINLKTKVSALDEVQVIAYGTTTKRLNTGDVTTVKAADIEKQPVSNPLLALEGRVPGMTITQSTGLPGSAVKVQIRGQNSILNGNDPLYIIDGVPYTSNNYLGSLSIVLGSSNTTSGGQFVAGSPFSYINLSDIESIDILKDADATAIYGTRGANGVILITTKKGKAGKTQVDINLKNGWGKVAEKIKLLNISQYLDMRHEAFKNDGVLPNPNADYDLTLWDTTRNTDWQKELIGGTAQYTDVQGTVSGGNTYTQFLISAGYHKETTVFPGNFNDQKGSVHFNINNGSPNGKFRILMSGLYTVDDNRLSGYDLTEQALQLAPDAPAMYNEDGTINWAHNAAGNSTWPNYNPAAMILLKYRTQTGNLISNALLSYHIMPGLDIKSSFGYTNTQTNEVQTIPLVFNDPAVRPYVQRSASFSDNNTHSWIIEPQITYTRKISRGQFSALLGTTIQQNISKGQQLGATGFNSDLVLENINSATSVTASSVSAVYKYNAAFAKLNYNWLDKYLVDLTARRDGSSRFGPANQFHNFGSIGAAWIFSKEKIIAKDLPFLSFGKLRGSFGTTGSDQVGDYTFMDLYAPNSLGVLYQGVTGSAPTRIFTPDLSWEETKKLEGGIEVGFLKDRVFFSASYYQNRSSNQLVGYLLPSIAGFTSVEKNLPAVVQNQGWEFELKTVEFESTNFRWTSSVNLTMNRNKLLSGARGLSEYYADKIGYPITARFAYRYIGVDPFTGLYQVADSHGNPAATPNPATDATVLININPKFYGGFQNSISYKQFQLDFLFQFVKTPSMLNYLYRYIPGSFNNSFGGNQPVGVLDRWQQPGDVKPVQRFSQNSSSPASWFNLQQSNQAFSDGSYIRLKNVSLSWQLPAKWQQRLNLQNTRLYVLGQNLLTITNYKGLDPETGSAGLPPLRVITAGIQVTL